MTREILTAEDVVTHLIDFSDAGSGSVAVRAVRLAIQAALREMTPQATRSGSLKRGRLFLKAPYDTGTITYDHTGGTYERQLTLASGIWPSWAQDGCVEIAGVVCDVESRKSDSVITLDTTLNPGEDVDAGTEYTLFKRYYHLPDDFLASSGFLGESLETIGTAVHPDEMLRLERYSVSAGTPRHYAIAAVQDLVGTLGAYVWPPVSEDTTWDYLYKRKPREIRHTGRDTNDIAGTITTNGTTTITGASTAFSDSMVGSVLRIGTTSNAPTGSGGSYQWADQRIITAVSSTASLKVDEAPSVTSASLKYVISDPIDIEPEFYNAFLARCRYELARATKMKDAGDYFAEANEAMRRARGRASHDRQIRTPYDAPVVGIRTESTLETS